MQGIPAVGTHEELIRLFSQHGKVAEHKLLKNYPTEEFCDTLLVKFTRIQSARYVCDDENDVNPFLTNAHSAACTQVKLILCYLHKHKNIILLKNLTLRKRDHFVRVVFVSIVVAEGKEGVDGQHFALRVKR